MAKNVLRCGGDGVGAGAGAGDVGEEEDDVGAGSYSVEEIAAGAGGEVARVQIEFFERRQICGQRSAGWFGVILHGMWRLYFVQRECRNIQQGTPMRVFRRPGRIRNESNG